MSKEQTESKEQTALVMTGTEEFALEQNMATAIAKRFLPNIDATKALNEKFQEVIAKEITEESVKEAKTLRLQYVKLRTATVAIHKTEKNAFLNGGRFVDSCKAAQCLNGEPCETKLKEIETHFETMRKEAVQKLQVEREVYLVEYGVEVFPSLLGEMEQAVWDNYINGVKLNFEAKKKEAAEVESLRAKQEEEAKAEQERIRLENEQLKTEAIEREATAKKEQDARDKADAARVAKEKVEQDARDAAEAKRIAKEKEAQEERDRLAKVEADKVRKAQEAAEAKLEEERKERVSVEAEERAKREALEAELKAKKDAEDLAEKQKEEARQAELSKGDEEKINDLIGSFVYIKDAFEFESKKNQKLFVNVQALCDKVVKYIEEQTKSI